MKKNILILLIMLFVAALCAFCVTACRGEKGSAGKDGADGVNVTGAFVEAGDLYLVLSNGEYVNCGKVVGTDGSDGEDGIDGIGIVDIKYNKDGELIIKFANGEERNIGISPKVCGHKYPDDWTVEKEADCTTQGYRYKTCTECGFIKSEIVSATGHDWDEENGKIVIPRETCTDCGWQSVVCKVCHESKMVELAPTTHHYITRNLIEEGRTVRECMNCAMRQPSDGLEFRLGGKLGNEYELVSLGSCSDSDIVIPDVIQTEYGAIPVTKISHGVFTGHEVTSVYLSKYISNIDVSTGSLFGNEDCEKLTSITIHEKNAIYRSDGNCIVDIQNKKVVAGCGASAIPSDGSVVTIGQNAFNGVRNLVKLIIPDKVVTIESMAFAYCPDIFTLTLGGSLEVIGTESFSHCIGLKNVTLNNINRVGIGAFAYCNELETVRLEYGCYRVGERAFSACMSLSSVYISGSVKGIGKYAFGGCAKLTDLRYSGSSKAWWDTSLGVGAAAEGWNKTYPFDVGYGETPLNNSTVKFV